MDDVKVDWFGSEANAEVWTNQELFKGKSKSEVLREYYCSFKSGAGNLVWELLPEHYNGDPGLNYPTVVSLDLGYKPDPTVVLFARVVKNRLFICDELVCLENTVYHVADKIKGKKHKLFWGACDSSAKKIDQTSALNVHSELQRELGIRFHTHKLPDKLEMWSQAQGAFYRGEVFIDPYKCPYLVECLTNMEWKSPGVFAHDKYSHAHDALVYLILNWKLKGTGPKTNAVGNMNKRRLGIRF